jgi:hypothetical protein
VDYQDVPRSQRESLWLRAVSVRGAEETAVKAPDLVVGTLAVQVTRNGNPVSTPVKLYLPRGNENDGIGMRETGKG